VADGSGYVPIAQIRSRPGLHPDDLDYHHVAPIEAWDRDYSRWRSNTTRVQREFMIICPWCLHIVPCVILTNNLEYFSQKRTMLQAGQVKYWGSNPGSGKMLFFSTASTQPSVQWILLFSGGLNRPGREADQ
jgi:hypothetical protein